MRVLVVTPVHRPVGQRAALYPRPLATIFNQTWPGQLDHYLPSGGDGDRGNNNVTRKFADARCVFLEGDWDAMLCAESDMLLPGDALQRLADTGADIAYGLYVFRHRVMWSAATRLEERGMTTLDSDPDRARSVFGSVIPVAGVGMGCTLIRRHVLERLAFRNWRGVAQDWALAVDAQAAGFSQVCDTGVVCGHLTMTPSPRVLWPDIDAPKLVRTDLL